MKTEIIKVDEHNVANCIKSMSGKGFIFHSVITSTPYKDMNNGISNGFIAATKTLLFNKKKK